MVKDRKDVFLIARITSFDKNIVEEVAKKQKVSISEIVRQMIKMFSSKDGD